MKQRSKKRLSWVMKQIWEVFQATSYGRSQKKRGTPPLIPVTKFMPRLSTASRMTIIRARKQMGIKSLKVAGSWRWRWPKNSLNDSLLAIGKKAIESKEEKERNKVLEVTELVRSTFQGLHYEVLAGDMQDECRAQNHQRYVHMRYIYKAKKALGARGVRKNGHIYWVWGKSEEIREWLESALPNGSKPLLEKELLQKASEKGWSRDVLLHAIAASKNQEGDILIEPVIATRTYSREFNDWAWRKTVNTHQ